MEYPTYSHDRDFLGKHTKLIELTNSSGARVLVAPSYQARVMTSSFGGESGQSFGWLNRAFIAAEKEDPKFNNYGGEDRFWIGPEAGQFGLWFKPGDQFNLNDFKTPPGFNSGAFTVDSASPTHAALRKDFILKNYSGAVFDCHAERTIKLIDGSETSAAFAVPLPANLKWVGFESVNRLVNAGAEAWREATGLVCVWILGMFNPLPRGKVIAPFIAGDSTTLGPEISDYFGAIPPDRMTMKPKYALFTCDGQMRTKIGVSPKRARNVIGSWDPDGRVLTIVTFNLPNTAADLPYVNCQWKIQENPYGGDTVNSYNDGLDPVTGILLGPFYELETSSCGVALKPGESITHIHRTFHFTGDFDDLNLLSQRVLGAELWE
ncbi:hypothetical protein D4S03_09515 [bacterium]|nr:MAG: hypothetical protein D4S03_09515 [bacterium]